MQPQFASQLRVASPRTSRGSSTSAALPVPNHSPASATSLALDDGTSNWAVFEPASDSPEPLHLLDAEPVRPDDPDVTHALTVLGLHVA